MPGSGEPCSIPYAELAAQDPHAAAMLREGRALMLAGFSRLLPGIVHEEVEVAVTFKNTRVVPPASDEESTRNPAEPVPAHRQRLECACGASYWVGGWGAEIEGTKPGMSYYVNGEGSTPATRLADYAGQAGQNSHARQVARMKRTHLHGFGGADNDLDPDEYFHPSPVKPAIAVGPGPSNCKPLGWAYCAFLPDGRGTFLVGEPFCQEWDTRIALLDQLPPSLLYEVRILTVGITRPGAISSRLQPWDAYFAEGQPTLFPIQQVRELVHDVALCLDRDPRELKHAAPATATKESPDAPHSPA